MLTSLPRDLLNNVVTPYLNGGDFFARLLALSHDSRSELKSSKKLVTTPTPLHVVAAHPDIVFTSIVIDRNELWSHTHLLTQCTQLTIDFNKPTGTPSTAVPANYFMVVPTQVTHLRLINDADYGNRMQFFPPSVTKLEMIGSTLHFVMPNLVKNVVELVVTELNVFSSWWPSLSILFCDKSVSIHVVSGYNSINTSPIGVNGFAYPVNRIICTMNIKFHLGLLKSLYLDTWDRSALTLDMIPDDLPFYVGGQRIDITKERLDAAEKALKKPIHYIELDLDDEPAPKRQRA